MSVTAIDPISGPFTPNSAATAFGFDFKAASAAEIAVLQYLNGTWSEIDSSSYSVVIDSDGEGGTVNFTVAPLTGSGLIYIVSDPDFAQSTDFGRMPFNISTITGALDRAAVNDLWLRRGVNRSIRAPAGEALAELPSAVNRAGKFAGFDAGGNPTALSGTGNDAALRTDIAAGTGAAMIGTLQSGAGAVVRTVQDKTREIFSIRDFSNHAAAMTAAASAGLALFVATPFTSPAANGAAMTVPHWGPAQLTTADGNKRGKWFSQVSARPSRAVFTDHDAIDTSFNGDWRNVNFVVEHRVTGAATLAQPTSDYLFTPEAAAFYGALYTSSGWNDATGGNGGRTGLPFFYLNLKHVGLGDVMGLHAAIALGGAKPGATHFLANPAGGVVTGEVTATASGVYAQGTEFDFEDQGFDIAAVADVRNFTRTNATAALHATWLGYRLQSNGSQPVDAMLSAVGKFRGGIDFSQTTLDLGTNKAAMLLKSGQRIYFNASSTNDYYATTVGTDFVERSANGLDFYFNGTLALRVADNKLAVNLAALGNFANDTAAATGSVAVGQLYRNGSALMVRAA